MQPGSAALLQILPAVSNVAAFAGVIKVGIEVRRLLIRLVGMRSTIPPQAEIQSQAMIDAPVVLNVGGERNVVPVPAGFDRVFFILLGIAEQEIGKVVTGEIAVEVEIALRCWQNNPALFVKRPAESELKLVRALGPGNVIAKLVIVGGVIPRRPIRSEVGSGAAIQVDRGNAIV